MDLISPKACLDLRLRNEGREIDMRIIPSIMCQSGMRLGKAISTKEGKVLIGYRVELTTSMLKKLNLLGIDYLYIEDPRTQDIHIEDPIHEGTRTLLRTSLGKVFERFSQLILFSHRFYPIK